jgi:hypothetical protein
MGGSCRLAVFAAALGLAACRRAGPLEPPPGPAAPTAQFTAPDGTSVPGSAQDSALKTGFDKNGNPVAAPGQNRTFILDPLLH